MADGARKPWEQTVQEVGAKVEEDLRRLVTYLNDEVVPDVRRSGSQALRTAAVELHRLAERMDGKAPGAPAPSPPVDTTKR